MTNIELQADDANRFSAYRADPPGTPIGGVIVIQEIFGVNDHIRAVTDQAAAAGFVAVAPHLFDRVRPGTELDYNAQGVEVGRDIAWNLPIDATMRDLDASAGYLADELGGPQHVGAVGFCYGGMLAAAMASRSGRHIAGAVAYYPSMAAQLLTDDRPQVPLLVHLGDLDARVTPADGVALEERWPTARFHHYQAGHGFNCDRRADHDPESAAQAWDRTTAFLAEAVGGAR